MLKTTPSIVLAMVSCVVLASCAGRPTILHGSKLNTSGAPTKSKNLTVFFVKPDSEGSNLVSVDRKLTGKDTLATAVEELLAGPSPYEEKAGLGTEIPRGTILLGVDKSGSDFELNLSKRFATGGGVSSFETRLAQLSRTVKGVTKTPVYLSVEGKRLNISEGEGIEIPQPINR